MIKIGVVGYPNVGKSAIINVLARRARAPVSQKAGTTRGIQWIKVGGLLILDSPGVIPFYDGELDLGVMGAKNPEKIKDIEKIAWEIIKMFIEYDKSILENTYGIIINDDNKERYTYANGEYLLLYWHGLSPPSLLSVLQIYFSGAM